jgi:hypothetical protein
MFPRYYYNIAAYVLLAACVQCAIEPTGTDRAQVLLGRLWEAARIRATELRSQEGDTEPGAWSAADMMAKAIDYTRDQLEKPPLDRVEYNLILLREAIEVLSRNLSETTGKRCSVSSKINLVPVQGERYTRIKVVDDPTKV